jgi:hypothetical protein
MLRPPTSYRNCSLSQLGAVGEDGFPGVTAIRAAQQSLLALAPEDVRVVPTVDIGDLRSLYPASTKPELARRLALALAEIEATQSGGRAPKAGAWTSAIPGESTAAGLGGAPLTPVFIGSAEVRDAVVRAFLGGEPMRERFTSTQLRMGWPTVRFAQRLWRLVSGPKTTLDDARGEQAGEVAAHAVVLGGCFYCASARHATFETPSVFSATPIIQPRCSARAAAPAARRLRVPA